MNGASTVSNDIAIVGMSVEVPGANDVGGFWDIVSSGRSLTRSFPIPRRGDIEEYVRYLRHVAVVEEFDRSVDFYDGCYLDDAAAFDYEFFDMNPKQAGTTDPHQRMILRNMYLALEDAGYTGERVTGSRTGVFIGFSYSGGTYLDYVCRVDSSLAPIALTGNIPTMLANRLSHFLNLHGPSMVIDTACSASLVALHQAKNALLLGDCDMAVVAGSRLVTAPIRHPTTKIGIESSDGVTRTFDDRADGTGFGEGSGVVVLKRRDRAEADGDRIYAVIKGSAVNHDGATEVVTNPDSDSQARLLTAAWENAGIDPRSIGYHEAHGTATRLGDPIEFEGLRRAFSRYTDDRQFCAVGTVKANIGHLFEGSGVMGLIKAALALNRRAIPPLANFEVPNTRIDFEQGPVFIPTELQPWPAGPTPRRAGVSAFGLGGTNCHVVLEEYVDERPARTAAQGPHLFTLSARSEWSLRRLAQRYATHLQEKEIDAERFADVCYTSNISRSLHRHRIAIIAADPHDLHAQLLEVIANGQPATPARRPDDARATVLAGVAADYLAGGDLRWQTLYEGLQPRVTDLVPYVFEAHRCWIDFPADWRDRWAEGGVRQKHPVTHDIRFEPAPPATEIDPGAMVLALVDPSTDAESLLGEQEADIEFLRLTEDASADAAAYFRNEAAEYERIADLVVEGGHTHVLHALAFDAAPSTDLVRVDERVRKNLYSLFLLTKALMAAGARVTLVVLTRKAIAARQNENDVVTENAALIGLAKVITREYPYIRTRMVDVDGASPATTVCRELFADEPGLHVLRGEERLHEVFAELPDLAPDPDRRYLKAGGTYLITGGTGAIGLEIGRTFAAQQSGINLVLLSRSGAPPRDEWDRIIASSDDRKLLDRLRALREMERLGAKVHVYAADAGDPGALTAVFGELRAQFGRIDGIVHAAGVPGQSILAFREQADFAAVVAPKLHGAFMLDQLTRDDRPDFILHFSSVAAVFPAPGQGDYAAANYYLDNLARARSGDGCHVVAIDWVAWREIGMAVDYGSNVDTTFKALPTAQAMAILDSALRSDHTRVFAGEAHYDGELVHLLKAYDIALAPEIEEKIDVAVGMAAERLAAMADRIKRTVDAVTVTLTGRPDGVYTPTEITVARCWAHAFGYDTLGVEADFFDLGGDSIMAMSVASNIATCLGVPFDVADLLMERTVTAVARLIDSTSGSDDFDTFDGFDGFDEEPVL